MTMKIYKVTNTNNGKVYIGSTKDSIETRKKDHIKKASSNASTKFYDAISTLPIGAFTWEQIDTAPATDELAQKEKNYIVEYNSKEEGYNSDSGGGFKKSVYQYNLDDGSLVATFDCLQDAGNAISATKQSISSACLSVNKTYGGFYWSYEFKEPFEPNDDKRKKEIVQLDLEGNVISLFRSVAEASRETRISKTCISRVCRGEREKTHEYTFKYK